MATGPAVEDWLTVEETADEHDASAIVALLHERDVPVRRRPEGAPASGGGAGEVAIEVPFDRLDDALNALEGLDEEDL